MTANADDNKLPWTGLLNNTQITRLKEAFPSFAVCPVYTSRFGTADEAGIVYVMGANADYYHAKKILARWYEKTTQAKGKGDKVEWWLDTLQEKGIEPVMSHDILNGLSHDRWTAYVATYKKLAAAQHQRTYHARKRAAIIKAKQENHRAARELLGLAGQQANQAGPSGGGGDGGKAGSKKKK